MPVFGPPGTKFTFWPEILNICDPSPRWTFCWSAVYTSKFPLSHVSSNKPCKLRTKFLLRHNHLGIRALAYSEGVKGVQPPLNVFNIVYSHKNTVKLCYCIHCILNFVQENVNNLQTYANFTFCFRIFFILLRPRPTARCPFRKFLIHHL